MHCPFCAHEDTKVIDSRLAGEGTADPPAARCLECGERFTTFETAELVMPRSSRATQRASRSTRASCAAACSRRWRSARCRSEAIEEAVGHIMPQAAQPRRARGHVAADRRARHGRTAPARRGRLRALRLGVSQLPGRRGVPRRDRAPAPPPRQCGARASSRCWHAVPRSRQEARDVSQCASTKPQMRARARARAARGLYSTHPNPRVGACWRATRKSSAKAGTSAPAKRTPKPSRWRRPASAHAARRRT